MKYDFAEDEIVQQAPLYALGSLSEDEARAFEDHLAQGCDSCRRELHAFKGIVERLGVGVVPQTPSADVRAKLFADLANEPQQQTLAQGHIAIRAGEGEWREVLDGVFTKKLFADEARGTITTLYKLKPGARLPDHRHIGAEECLVLEGDFHVNGETFGPGDYRCALPGSVDETLYTVEGALFVIIAPAIYEPLETGVR